MKIQIEKQKAILIITAVFGIALIIIGGNIGKNYSERNSSSGNNQYTDIEFYTAYLEKRICSLCTSIEGISEAEVFLTLDSSSEQVYSENGASDFLILSDKNGEHAAMLYEVYPRVRGIAVVCSGGELPRVKETVTELLSAALDLPSNKIKVAGN